jgi:hypothetical protein
MPKELMGVVQFRMAMAWQRVERAEDVHPRFLRDASVMSEMRWPAIESRRDHAGTIKIESSDGGSVPTLPSKSLGAIHSFLLPGFASIVGSNRRRQPLDRPRDNEPFSSHDPSALR